MTQHANRSGKMNNLSPDSEDRDYNPLSSVLHSKLKAPGESVIIPYLSYAENNYRGITIFYRIQFPYYLPPSLLCTFHKKQTQMFTVQAHQ